MNNIEIKSTSSVNLLGIEIDNKLSFDNHVASLCKKAANQLNALCRIHNHMGKKEKEVIINSFIYSNFNYCPLVWHFCSKRALNKIEKIQERCLRLVLNDYTSNYEELLQKSGNTTMEIRRLRTLAIEIFKTLNNINPSFMKDIFYQSPYASHKEHNLFVQRHNTVRFGQKSLKTLGPQIWNSLPENIRLETNLTNFKSSIKKWFGPKCACNLCSFQNQSCRT